MRIEDRLRGLGDQVRNEAEVPSSIPPQVVRRIRLRQAGLVALSLSLITLLAYGAVAGLEGSRLDRNAKELPPGQTENVAEIITTVEFGGETDIFRIHQNDPSLPEGWGDSVLIAHLGDLDRWGLAEFPMENDVEWGIRDGEGEWAIYGAVSDQATKVTIRMSAGRVFDAELFPIPERFGTEAQAFVIKLDTPQTGGQIIATDADGTLLGSEIFPASHGEPPVFLD